MTVLFAFALVLCVSNALAYNCNRYFPGVGYTLERGCGRCICGKDNQPVCTYQNALWCPRRPRMVNNCGEKADGHFDGCNYCSCGPDGKPGACTLIGCRKSTNKSPGEKWTTGVRNCKKCVASVQSIAFCNSDDCPGEHPSSGPDKDFDYCSKYAKGLGFYDQNTCKLCYCKSDGTPICKPKSLYERPCTPNGQSLINQCGRSNKGKNFFDGCNECTCGKIGTWPTDCVTRAGCTRDRCGGRQAGDTWSEGGKRCVCTHHGTPFCVDR